jgi:NAD(P)-dependent dehydrogenase (short-subunit alcohol dehydrogenase family)
MLIIIIIKFLLISLFFLSILFYIRKFLHGSKNYLKHSLQNKFIIITGSNSGIGKQTALNLLSENAKIIFACRNKTRALELINSLSKNKQNAIFIELDLCDFNSIKTFSNIIIKNYPKIDILINNAGAQPIEFNLTKDKYDTYLQGNFLGPSLLTFLLIPHMNKNSRIINVSSLGHYFSDLNEEINNNNLIFNDLERFKKKYYSNEIGKFNLYFTTKLMIIFLTEFLAEFFIKKGNLIKIVSLHPGIINSEYLRFLNNYKIIYKIFIFVQPIWNFFAKNCEEGAQTQLFLSYVDWNEIVNGGYYSECKLSLFSKKVRNKKLKKKIVDWTINEINKNGFKFNFNI